METGMKKISIILLLLVLPLMLTAGNGGGTMHKREIFSLVDQYRDVEGFEVINVGRVGTSLAKLIAGFVSVGDEDVRELLRLAKNVNRLAVVDYEDCDGRVRQEFSGKVEKALSDSEMLLEIKDGSEVVRIFGAASEDGAEVKDFILFAPGDCTLVCLFGSIPMEAVASMMEV